MFFLIDSENLDDSIYNDVSELTSNDTIIIFYSAKTSKLKMTSHINLLQCDCNKEYIPIHVGTKNALDFQLVTYLGFLLAEDLCNNTTNEYGIISNDKGYDAVCKFWKDKNFTVKRYINLKLDNEDTANDKIKIALQELTLTENESKKIHSILSKTKTKQGLHTALVKEFSSEKGSTIYKAIKAQLA